MAGANDKTPNEACARIEAAAAEVHALLREIAELLPVAAKSAYWVGDEAHIAAAVERVRNDFGVNVSIDDAD